MTNFTVGPVISEEMLKDIKNHFWAVYCDECRSKPEVEQAAYNVLVALESYRKALNGNFV